MSELPFRERVANFFSYVTFFGFLIVASIGGYYLYQHFQTAPSAVAVSGPDGETSPTEPAATPALEPQKPSELMQTLMMKNLPLLWKDLTADPVVLSSDFATVESLVNHEKSAQNSMQPAWRIASDLCVMMKHTLQDRNKIAASIQHVATPEPAQKSAASNLDQATAASRQEFFNKATEQKWKATIPARKRTFDSLYRQLVASEKRG